MSRFLVVTWDGAGNLVPTLAIARRLVEAGHDVRLLGHASIEQRCGNHGWRFRRFEQTMDLDSASAPADASMTELARGLWFGSAVAEDVRAELVREAADTVIADCMLFGALCAAEAAATRTVALFHGALTLFRTGPFANFLSFFLADLNRLRARLGQPAVDRATDVHDACALSVVATPKEFESLSTIPPNVVFAGPLLEGPGLSTAVDPLTLRTADVPTILVSLSTSDQGQVSLIRKLVPALSMLPARTIVTTGPAVAPSVVPAAANVHAARYVPHDRLLPEMSLVVTHAGLGTVMSALRHGVPLLCLPFGRDQFFNAARVESFGIGRTESKDAAPEALGTAAAALLADENVSSAARQFAGVIRSYRGGESALRAIEALN